MEQENYSTVENLEKVADEKYLSMIRENNMKDILSSMGRFPENSIKNDMLILAQMPNATKVYTKEEWNFKGRELIESPRYINNISLCLYKPDQDFTDSKGTLYVKGADKLNVRLKTLYDVSQTEGKELPKEIDKETIAQYFDATKGALEHTAKGYKIEYADMEEKSKIDQEAKVIKVKDGISLNEVITELVDKVTTVLLGCRKPEGLTEEKLHNIADLEHSAAVYAIHSRYSLDLPEIDFSSLQRLTDSELISFRDNLQKVRSVVYQLTHNLENSIDFTIRGQEKQKEQASQNAHIEERTQVERQNQSESEAE